MWYVILRKWSEIPKSWVTQDLEGKAPADTLVGEANSKEKAEIRAHAALVDCIHEKGLEFDRKEYPEQGEDYSLYRAFIAGKLVCACVDPCTVCKAVHFCDYDEDRGSCSILS